MVIPSISNPYFPSIVEAIEQTLFESGRDLLLCDSRGNPELERLRLRALADRWVDGLLIIPCDERLSGDALNEVSRTVPIVQVDRWVEGFDGDFVGVDGSLGVHKAIEHLKEQGCQTFAFVGAQPTSSTGRIRLETFQRLVPQATSDCILLGDFTAEWGRQAARQLLELRRLPHAVVCAADVIAVGLMGALRDAGVALPADVMVTGFDDIGLAQLSIPSLTSVRQPLDALAHEAVRLLDHRRKDRSRPPQRSQLAPTVVVRGSTSWSRTDVVTACKSEPPDDSIGHR